MIHFRRLVQERGERRTFFSLAVGYLCGSTVTATRSTLLSSALALAAVR